MFYNLVPAELQNDFDALLNDLSYLPEQAKESCPFCHHIDFQKIRQKPLTFRCKCCHKYFNPLTKTPFNRLVPTIWLGLILTRRIEKVTLETLAYELNCTPEMVKRREHALIDYMQQHYPKFHQWYTQTRLHENNMLPTTIKQQYIDLSKIIDQLLTIEKFPCVYCQSSNTVRIGQRAGFRCRSCRKTFNILKDTPLNKIPHAELWKTFIELLVKNNTNKSIAQTLELSLNTVSKWRKVWCELMQNWGYEELAVWCNKKQ